MSFFTKENITFFIALIGFLLSIWNFLRDLHENRKDISISLPCVHEISGILFMKVIMINNSRLPISVTRMQIHCNNKNYELGQASIEMFYYEHPERKGKATESTVCLPVHLDPLGFSVSLFHISDCEIPAGSNLIVELSTNRGVIKKAATLPEITDDALTFLRYLG